MVTSSTAWIYICTLCMYVKFHFDNCSEYAKMFIVMPLLLKMFIVMPLLLKMFIVMPLLLKMFIVMPLLLKITT